MLSSLVSDLITYVAEIFCQQLFPCAIQRVITFRLFTNSLLIKISFSAIENPINWQRKGVFELIERGKLLIAKYFWYCFFSLAKQFSNIKKYWNERIRSPSMCAYKKETYKPFLVCACCEQGRSHSERTPYIFEN